MSEHVWVRQVLDGEPRYLRSRPAKLQFHLAAGWSPVDEHEVPVEVRHPARPRMVRRPQAPPVKPPRMQRKPREAPPRVAAPRRRPRKNSAPAEES